MKEIVVDTSVLIEFLRVSDRKTVYETILDKGFLPVLSFITVSELWAGKSVWEEERLRTVLEKLISGVKVVYPNYEALTHSGKLRAEHGISLLDCFIASLALDRKLPLVTLNKKDFLQIPGLQVV